MYYEVNGHIINASSIHYIEPDGTVCFGDKSVTVEDPEELEALKRILKTKKLVAARGKSDAEQHKDYLKFNPALAPDGPATNAGANDAGKKKG